MRPVPGPREVTSAVYEGFTGVRQAREAAEHLVGLVDTTLVQLDSLPGAKLVRRRMSRGAGNGAPPSLMP